MARGRNEGDAIRITTAPVNRRDDIAARQRRYLLSMSLRTICFVGAIIAFLAGVQWLWPVLIAGAIVLPYFAVVMANAAAGRAPEIDLQNPSLQRRELGGVAAPSSGPYQTRGE
jgi:hypothetical protein